MIPLAGVSSLPTEGMRSYLYQRSAEHRHQGVDLGGQLGAPVYAADAGIVTHASEQWAQGFSGYGRHVVLEHQTDPPLWTLYAHLDSVAVLPGDYVSAGERIGAVGRTKFSAPELQDETAGAHLHFEVSPSPYPQASEAPRLDPVAWLLEQSPELEYSERKTQQRAGGVSAGALLALGFGAWFWLRRRRRR